MGSSLEPMVCYAFTFILMTIVPLTDVIPQMKSLHSMGHNILVVLQGKRLGSRQ